MQPCERNLELMMEHIQASNNPNTHNPYYNILLPPHPVPNVIANSNTDNMCASGTHGGNYNAHPGPNRSNSNTFTTTGVQIPQDFKTLLAMAQNKECFTLACFTIWDIWLARNARVHRKLIKSKTNLADCANSDSRIQVGSISHIQQVPKFRATPTATTTNRGKKNNLDQMATPSDKLAQNKYRWS